MEKLGSLHGGWIVPADMIDSDWICYCGGVGEDITFDLELIKRFSCEIFAFDPTPRAIAHIRKTAADEKRYHFFDHGLWSSDGEQKFFSSRNQQLVNHSIVNLQGTADFFIASCKRISTIMREMGHRSIDFLKIDIEGSEYEVLNSLMEDDIRIKVLCVEFDQPVPITRVYAMTLKVIRWGYVLTSIDGWNFTFIKKEMR